MRILKFKEKNLNKAVKKAVISIKNGDVLVCPTDTVYGLVCDATSRKAVKELFRIKKRPKEKPISIFVKDLKMAKKFAKIDKRQEEFLNKVWLARPNFSRSSCKQELVKITPKIRVSRGAVTAVLKSRKILPKEISAGKDTIGVRIPNYGFIPGLINEVGQPLAESSANISGRPPSTKIKIVLGQFKDKKNMPDLIIDAGDLKKAKPSIVIDLTVIPPKVLRV